MIDLLVYSRSLTQLGDISEYDNLEIERKYDDVSRLVLHAPKTPENVNLLKHRNILATYENPDYGYIIEHIAYIKEGKNDIIEIYAYSLNVLLKANSIDRQMRTSGNVENVIKYFIYHNAIEPTNPNRIIPNLVLGANTGITINDTSAKTGGNLLEHSFAISKKHDMCIDVLINHETKELEVVTWQGANRATDQSINPHVMFSTEFDNVLQQNYFESYIDYKNVAIVAGEGEGIDRKIITVNNYISGDNRRELFVDARDLQSTYYDEDNNEITLTNAEYEELLRKRGLEALAETIAIESFESTVDDTQYILGQDYFLGDRVTFVDEDIGIIKHVRVNKIYTVSNRRGVTHKPSFGTGLPNKLKKGV